MRYGVNVQPEDPEMKIMPKGRERTLRRRIYGAGHSLRFGIIAGTCAPLVAVHPLSLEIYKKGDTVESAWKNVGINILNASKKIEREKID